MACSANYFAFLTGIRAWTLKEMLSGSARE
jgi:hypothetical protein